MFDRFGTGELDRLIVPVTPLDVLAQQIVAMAAVEDWQEADLFQLVRRTYCYRDLSRADFDAVIDMLSEGISTKRGRSGAYLHRDRVHGVVRGRRGARLAAITSGGAIPDNAQYLVLAEPDETVVGTLDEDFAVESLAGDVFLLGHDVVAHSPRRGRPGPRRRRARRRADDSVLARRSARPHRRAVQRGVRRFAKRFSSCRRKGDGNLFRMTLTKSCRAL